MTAPVRLGAVEYLNARPLVYGLEHSTEFSLRYDVPARCAELLHANQIDVGLIPSIEYLRGSNSYAIVFSPVVASDGAVASVALYTRREPGDIRSIALDTTSRTSVALTRVLARRAWNLSPELVPMAPDLETMLGAADAALVIGDRALFLDHAALGAAKIDLGELWKQTTGLPFVYAFWAGRPDSLTAEHVRLLQEARDLGVAHPATVAAEYFPGDRERQAIAEQYLRDNIRYSLRGSELEGLRTFYRYAAELGLVTFDDGLRFYHAEPD